MRATTLFPTFAPPVLFLARGAEGIIVESIRSPWMSIAIKVVAWSACSLVGAMIGAILGVADVEIAHQPLDVQGKEARCDDEDEQEHGVLRCHVVTRKSYR